MAKNEFDVRRKIVLLSQEEKMVLSRYTKFIKIDENFFAVFNEASCMIVGKSYPPAS